MPTCRIHVGDAETTLSKLLSQSVHCCVTSPPYWGLRDYGHDEQIGLEDRMEDYISELVGIFREVKRVLRDDGTVWLNLGDSYAAGGRGNSDQHRDMLGDSTAEAQALGPKYPSGNLKPKDKCLIPHRVAIALQEDGWYVRSTIVWAKGNPMPESVTDRPTSSHEYIFLLSKSERYYYDADAIREPSTSSEQAEHNQKYAREYQATAEASNNKQPGNVNNVGIHARPGPGGRNKRDVWQINTKPFPGAHFAVFPPDLVEPCIKAGTSKKGVCPECGAPWKRDVDHTPMDIDRSSRSESMNGARARAQASGTMTRPAERHTTGWSTTCECGAGDPIPATVLDPFAGAGTTGLVSLKQGRHAELIELSPEYANMAADRIRQDAGTLFHSVDVVE